MYRADLEGVPDVLATTRDSQRPVATIEHREGDRVSGKLLSEIRVEELWTTNVDGEPNCIGLKINVFRGDAYERIELVLP